jgi:glycosyltransferase involved in cell wall biosynthesis
VSLRIGIFVALLPPEHQGGAELQAERMARELAARGHDVHLFARRQPGRGRAESRQGVHVHRRPVLPVPGLRFAAEVAQAVGQASRIRPDVLLAYITMNSGVLAAACGALAGAPFVVWTRLQGESFWNASSSEKRLAFEVYRRAAGVWTQADAFTRTLEEEYARAGRSDEWHAIAKRVRVLGNGIDLPPPEPADAPLPPANFLFVGRLVEQKDLPVLVQAAKALGDAARVTIAGSGPLRATLEEAARGAPVQFVGELPNTEVGEWLRRSRALVLPSRQEGLPNVVLEALARGRPVISTRVGAVPEYVRDGVNGRLVPVGDAGALAQAMREALDASVWRHWAQAARPAVQGAGWPALVDRVEAELQALVTGRNGAGGAHGSSQGAGR